MEKEHRNKLFDFFNAVNWVILSPAAAAAASNIQHRVRLLKESFISSHPVFSYLHEETKKCPLFYNHTDPRTVLLHINRQLYI